MKRRLTALVLAAGAAASLGAVPAPASLPLPEPQLPELDGGSPFPLGFCVYVRPLDPDDKYCLVIHDPR